MQRESLMAFAARFSFAVGVLLLASGASAAPAATIFRIFMLDGSAVTSYGEFARLDDSVIFSMPAGGRPDEPRLHLVTLPASLIDWPRTERYAAAARHKRYAETRGEDDFQKLSNDVARVLNDVALTTDRSKALELAEQARRTLAEWPQAHFGYRQSEVSEIVSVLDEAIAGLRGTSGGSVFELSLVAMASPLDIEPLHGMPTPREQIDEISRVIRVTPRAVDRVELLRAAMALIAAVAADGGITVPGARRALEAELAREIDTDRRYQQLAERLAASAARAARDGRVADVQRVLDRVAAEDARLGGRRPEIVRALRGSVQAHLDAARRLRLLQDQWAIRRTAFRDYERTVGGSMAQLTRALPMLEAVRSLNGPAPEALTTLRGRLKGGAERLERLHIPEELRATHELLVGAWRFAESAVEARYQAATSGNIATAWEASSAAAGAVLLMSRVQQEIRALLTPPTLP
jgi:hypothetical protein